jgi:RNA polymerase sigma-70 factor (ECF subfamily)
VDDKRAIFEQTILPHLDAAYNLARWLSGNEHDAEDIVQESCLRAVKFFGNFRGGNARAWLLAVVRNTAYTWLKRRQASQAQFHLDEGNFEIEDRAANPDTLLTTRSNIEKVRGAIAQLPPEFREVIVLREMEDCSYKEIADLVDAPVGTVMSRLARGRKQLQKILCEESQTSEGKS